MRAAVYHGREDVRIEELDEDEVGPGEVRVDVGFCGICGTDIHEYAHGPVTIPDGKPHPVTGETLPVTLGHELSGTVAETGEGVDDLPVGERVAVNPLFSCGTCRYCEEGRYALCDSLVSLGLHGRGGGFADSVVVPAENVVSLPEGVSLEEAALVEPLSVAVHAVRQSGVTTGDSVAVFGAGPIGLGVLQAAVATGAGDVYVIEPRDARRERAEALGATGTVDPAERDPVRFVSAATEGGVDVAIDAAGTEPTMTQAVRASKKAGTVVIVSFFGREVEFNPDFVMMAERSVVGSFGYAAGPLSRRGEFAATIGMLRDGRLDARPLVTKRVPLGDVTEGFRALLDPDGGHIKVVVDPDG
jgi:(R,R)-butanediol dehydrogenase/meso-butanediol dehydrogenase/diacetyl reductase